jgi:hypothetical protein
MIKVRLFTLILPPLLVLALGCGATSNTPSTVTGSVTYNDKPVTGGTITFQAEGGGNYPLSIQPDGTYSSISEMPPGEMAVSIETESLNKDKKKPDYGGGRGPGTMEPPPGVGGDVGTYVKIPPKYGDPKKSGLTATLAKGKNTKNFDLKD